MIYKNESFGDSKYYMVVSDIWGNSEVIEYVNGCEKTKLSMNPEQASNFIAMLEKNNWIST